MKRHPLVDTLLKYWVLIIALFAIMSALIIDHYRLGELEKKVSIQWSLIHHA